jgi:hypothetical protein
VQKKKKAERSVQWAEETVKEADSLQFAVKEKDKRWQKNKKRKKTVESRMWEGKVKRESRK